MPLDSARLMEQIELALSDPAPIDALYEIAFDESASAAARQYAIRNLLKRGYARPEATKPSPDFTPEPMSERTRSAFETILARLK